MNMWSLFDKKGELKPLVFSNGKNQQDIVKEVVSEIKKGTKIVFIHGVCGSGKSSIALNVAKELGRASIIVPIKNLQRQYETDYMGNKYVLKNNGQRLKISMITGRNNHKCPFYEEKNTEISEASTREVNTSIYDIFKKREEEEERKKERKDFSCDNPVLPCKIEIKEKNIRFLKKYYFDNPEKRDNSILDLKSAKRMAVAPACPYWSPVFPSELKIGFDTNKIKYNSISKEQTIYLRKEGCPYYEQFRAYKEADVIIFNSRQYILETYLGRKPATDVEIIDECDEFLDNFAIEGSVNLTRLKNEVLSLFSNEPSKESLIKGMLDVVLEIIKEGVNSKDEEIIPLKKTKFYELIKIFTKNDCLELVDYDEDSYLEHCFEVCNEFKELIDDGYLSFYKDKKKGDILAKLVTINLEKVFNMLIEKNKAFVMMSGTIHSERILKEIFGIKDFKIIEAERENQGAITRVYTGLEKDFKFDNFFKGVVSRKDYLLALDKCVEMAKRPTVVQVNSFQDLPSEAEIFDFDIKYLISSERLVESQKNDKRGDNIHEFKLGKTKLLFTTRCNRGIDFPFETCNSVVITKFPYPNTQSLFWRILKKNKPLIFWEFYKDKAHRELLQRIYRSVRAKDDHIFLLSPDIRVLRSVIAGKSNI